jgi:cell division protein FtsN
MTKDFAKSRTQTDASKSRLPGWVWFVVGLSLGVFGSFIFYVSQVVPVDAEVAELLDQPKPNTSTARNKVEDLKWEFHEIFPKSVVPIIEEYGTDGTKHQTTTAVSYLLQAGSFRRAKDADKLRGELILIGLEPKVKKIRKDNELWHRVVIGPLDTEIELTRTRNRLAEASIESIALKVN